MATAKKPSQREQQRREQQSAQHVEPVNPYAKAADDLGTTPEVIEEAMRTISTVNLDEVTDETIRVAYWHFWLEETEDSETHEKIRVRKRTLRHVNLIKDVPSELLYQFMQLQGSVTNLKNADPATYQKILHLLHEVWCFTLPDAPYEDVQMLPLEKVVALIQRFFN
jgi:DNA replicative helicase MCM subunit Mcm2 (Cdc46/Mcm family)